MKVSFSIYVTNVHTYEEEFSEEEMKEILEEWDSVQTYCAASFCEFDPYDSDHVSSEFDEYEEVA
ncbi:MAG: hypothetical protein G8D91_09225 [gamma proteobacterium symbiont of Clathrolucina costata]